MPKWLSMEGNCFTAGGFPSNPIPVRVCAPNKSYFVLRTEEIIGSSKLLDFVGLVIHIVKRWV
jgi:hypothetical protein